jgi:succinate dehydrogenase flavin-adding protein (antitoxin of CptAB toxin-antitoxin module)
MNFVRAISSEGFGRIKYHRKIRRMLDEDITVQQFFEGETTELPAFYCEAQSKAGAARRSSHH